MSPVFVPGDLSADIAAAGARMREIERVAVTSSAPLITLERAEKAAVALLKTDLRSVRDRLRAMMKDARQ